MRRIIVGTVAVVAVAAIGVGVGYAIQTTASKPELSPSGMENDGVLVKQAAIESPTTEGVDSDPKDEAAAADKADKKDDEKKSDKKDDESAAEPVDIHIYVDYLSEASGAFEQANARQIAGWINEKAVTVTYHPVSLLTASSNGTKYSLRAAAASACVATYAPDSFYAYNHALLTSQPKVDSNGLTDVELADLAGAVGIDTVDDVRSCIEGGDYVSWAKDATARALEDSLPGTKNTVLSGAPMIVVNGEVYDGSVSDAAEFSQFVLTVASDAYYGEATPTPTPTAKSEAKK